MAYFHRRFSSVCLQECFVCALFWFHWRSLLEVNVGMFCTFKYKSSRDISSLRQMVALILVLLINALCGYLLMYAQSWWERDPGFGKCRCDFGSRVPCAAFVVVRPKLGAELFGDAGGEAAHLTSVHVKSSSGTWRGETFSAWVCWLLLWFSDSSVLFESTTQRLWASIGICMQGWTSFLADTDQVYVTGFSWFRWALGLTPLLLQKSLKILLYFWRGKAISGCSSCSFVCRAMKLLLVSFQWSQMAVVDGTEWAGERMGVGDGRCIALRLLGASPFLCVP